jgi:tetratricopeptide (TPR) repeat protein
MKKTALGLFFAAFLSISAIAQTVQDGIGHMYAQRYASAQSVFEKLLAANPNNIDATYWLGQNYLAQKDIKGARTVYEKALMANGNAPLLMVGMGHVELVEGKLNEGRAHFEAAINASKGRKGNDANILNAVGRANVQAFTESAKNGDLNYAITKLTEAAQITPNNPDIFLNLGNAYRKLGNKGGEAVQAYRRAAQVNSAFAIAPYRIAMLYKTQVNYRDPAPWTVVLDNLNAAIAADPKFAPAYEELYYYNLFAKQDFTTAENFARQYVSNSDPSVENDYLIVQTHIVQKDYAKAISAAKNIVSQTNNNARPRVYRALAVASMGAGDSTAACEYINQFFTKASDDDILGSDYIIHAQTCARGNTAMIREDVSKAIQGDSVLSRQIKTLNEFIDDAKSSGDRSLEAELRLMSYQLRKDNDAPTSPTELISYVAVPYYLGGDYKRADSIAKEYTRLAPDSIYGYYWSALARQAYDTGDAQKGLFVEDYEKVLQIAMTDTVRYKVQGVKAASTLAIYSANVKRDYPAAKAYAEQGLKFDAQNANLLNIIKVLGNIKQPAPRPSASSQQKNSGTNSGRGS